MKKEKVEKIIEFLNENNVKYVIIGAFAFSSAGYVRGTLDIDIFIKPEIENIKKCRSALEEAGYDFQNTKDEDILKYKILFRQYDIPLDIHPFVKGVTFEQLWKNKKTDFIGKTKAYFASLNELIKMKSAAARPKDVEDLKYLKEIKKQTRRKAKKRDEKK